MLRQLDDEYESRLVEEGLEDGEGGTLGITTIVGLALLIVVSIAYMLLGFGIYSAEYVEDEDKILVLSPGAFVSATDTDTGDVLNLKSEATTTKLEEDEIANLSSDGRISP